MGLGFDAWPDRSRPTQALTADLIRALDKAGAKLPNVNDAPQLLLRSVAGAIIAERVDPIRAAEWLSDLYIELDSTDLAFHPFVYAASEASGRPEDRDLFVHMVKTAAADVCAGRKLPPLRTGSGEWNGLETPSV